MNLDVPLSLEPMEAAPADDLPAANDVWQYEPKIDGFRCLIFRDGDEVHLQSKNQRPFERFFPEMVAGEKALRRKRFVLDGELVIPSVIGPHESSASRTMSPDDQGRNRRIRPKADSRRLRATPRFPKKMVDR